MEPSPSEELFYRLSDLNLDLLDSEENELHVILQARLHHVRKKGNMLFMLLREGLTMLQVVCFKKSFGAERFREILDIPKESIVRIRGNLIRTPMLIATTNSYLELHASEISVVSTATELKPIQVEDLNQYGEERQGRPEVQLHNRLNYRVLDLRSLPNQAIYRLRTRFEMIIRDFMLKNRFVEMHSPKLISIASESGAQVFPVQYFDRPAYLAQSPQLYKQMLINSDFGRVFEIGAVYRAEPSFSHRHLCEFTGFDFEMELQPQPNNQNRPDYHQVFDLIENFFHYLRLQLREHATEEMEILLNYFPGETPVIPAKIPVINFQTGVAWLNEAGFSQGATDDLNHEAERLLGQLVKEKLNSDLFFLEAYPSNLRPFYTMLEPDNPQVTRSYDLIFRGQEIASGAQRINDPELLKERMTAAGLTLENYADYINSFSWGSPPHAGVGIGLERLFSFYFNIPDVHYVSLFPRDPHRLTP